MTFLKTFSAVGTFAQHVILRQRSCHIDVCEELPPKGGRDAFLTDFLLWGVVMVTYNLPELIILAIGFSRLNLPPMAVVVPSIAIAVVTQMILIMVASVTAYGFLYLGFIASAVIGTIALLVLSPHMKMLSQQRHGGQATHAGR